MAPVALLTGVTVTAAVGHGGSNQGGVAMRPCQTTCRGRLLDGVGLAGARRGACEARLALRRLLRLHPAARRGQDASPRAGRLRPNPTPRTRVHPLAQPTLGQTGWAKWVAEGRDRGTTPAYIQAAYGRGRARPVARRDMVGQRVRPDDSARHQRAAPCRDRTQRHAAVPAPGDARSRPRSLRRRDRATATGRGRDRHQLQSPGHPGCSRLQARDESLAGGLVLLGRAEGTGAVAASRRYADTRLHSVPGASLDERRRHLEAYQEHLVALAERDHD